MADLDEVKMNLRSVLISSPGIQQGKLLKEYQDCVQERLNFRELGFSSLYLFLKSLEGDVTRMEFCEDLKDNIIYCVPDKTKYTSKHAIKNAEKYGTGVPAKSPEELTEFLRGKSSSQPNKKKQNKILTSLTRKDMMAPIVKSSPVNKPELLPTNRELNILANLRPDSSGLFWLSIENVGVSQSLTLFKSDLQTYFELYRPKSIGFYITKKRCGIISFENYVNAFKAWLNKKSTVYKGQRIGCFPKNLTELDRRKYFVVKIEKLPSAILLSTLVDAFNLYPGLSKVVVNGNTRYAEISYSLEKSAIEAISVNNIKGNNGNWYPLNISYKKDIARQSLLPTPPRQLIQPLIGQGQPLMGQGDGLLPSPPTSVKSEPVKDNSLAIPVSPPAKIEDPVDEEEVIAKKFLHLKCPYRLNYYNWLKMFKKTCNKTPKDVTSFPIEIEFLVSYHDDPCSFWIMRLDDPKATFGKLEDIEKELEADMKRVNKPNEHPKVGMRGAALYSVVNKWYRCWVLSSNEEKDEIIVFFCDYGNIETTNLDNYRCTYSATWALPPMAIPCVFKGYMPNESNVEAGMKRLSSLVTAKRFRGSVVKQSSEHQPHIIELEHIKTNDCECLEELMFNEGFIVKSGHNNDITQQKINIERKDATKNFVEERTVDARDQQNNEDLSVEKSADEVSNDDKYLFDYDNDQLVKGMFAQVHSTSLIYVYLGPLDGFGELTKRLHDLPIPPEAYVEVNALLIYIDAQGIKIRVIVMETGSNNMAKVLHVDFGVIEWVPCKRLYDITDELYDYPFQARPAELAGITCTNKEREAGALKFLQTKIKHTLQFNIIETLDSGKVVVEVFEEEKTKLSINKYLVYQGFAQLTSASKDNDFNENQSTISDSLFATEKTNNVRDAATNDFKRVRKSSASSVASWNSNPSFDNVTFKKDRVDNWVHDSLPPRPETPPFPPPDIVTSTTVPSIEISPGIKIEGNMLILGAETGVEERLELTENKRLDENEIAKVREKWRIEKDNLLNEKRKLERLIKLDASELNKIYREKKKEKLQKKLRLKDLESEADKLKLQIEDANHEIELLLSQI